jgi:hypothetical protein
MALAKDPTLQSILSTFFIDLVIFLLELTVFFCIRSSRDRDKE